MNRQGYSHGGGHAGSYNHHHQQQHRVNRGPNSYYDDGYNNNNGNSNHIPLDNTTPLGTLGDSVPTYDAVNTNNISGSIATATCNIITKTYVEKELKKKYFKPSEKSDVIKSSEVLREHIRSLSACTNIFVYPEYVPYILPSTFDENVFAKVIKLEKFIGNVFKPDSNVDRMVTDEFNTSLSEITGVKLNSFSDDYFNLYTLLEDKGIKPEHIEVIKNWFNTFLSSFTITKGLLYTVKNRFYIVGVDGSVIEELEENTISMKELSETHGGALNTLLGIINSSESFGHVDVGDLVIVDSKTERMYRSK